MPRGAPSRIATASAGVATRPGVGGEHSPVAVAVLEVVDSIPRGKVLTYGDIAELVGMPRSPRRVGAVLAKHGHEVTWWRVVQASGAPTKSGPEEATRRLRAEKVPFRGDKVDMVLARWDGR